MTTEVTPEAPASRATIAALEPQYIDVDGVQTRYFEAGTGEPMVFWHGDDIGGAANAATWDLNLNSLSKTFHVFAADRLGMGFSGNPLTDADYTMPAIIQHAFGFLRALNLTGIHMVGQSRGAYVAARLTLEHPELVKTLTLVDTASLAPETVPGDQELARRLVNGPSEPRAYAHFRWSAMSFSDGHITEHYLDDSGTAGLLPKTAIAKEKMAALRAGQFGPSAAAEKEETLRWIDEGRLSLPVLVVWGYNDPLAPLASGLALFDRIVSHAARAQFHIFNQAGHYPYREHADDFNALVTAFTTYS